MQQIPAIKRAFQVYPTLSKENRNICSYLPFSFEYLYVQEPGVIRVNILNSDSTPLLDPNEFLSAFSQAESSGGLFANLYGFFPSFATFGVCARVLSVTHHEDNIFILQTDFTEISNTNEPVSITIGVGIGMDRPFYIMPVRPTSALPIEIEFFSYAGDEVKTYWIRPMEVTPCQLSVFGGETTTQLFYATEGWRFLMLW